MSQKHLKTLNDLDIRLLMNTLGIKDIKPVSYIVRCDELGRILSVYYFDNKKELDRLLNEIGVKDKLTIHPARSYKSVIH